jgi:hypothetical protein
MFGRRRLELPSQQIGRNRVLWPLSAVGLQARNSQ